MELQVFVQEYFQIYPVQSFYQVHSLDLIDLELRQVEQRDHGSERLLRLLDLRLRLEQRLVNRFARGEMFLN